jgi:hypothetical protein
MALGAYSLETLLPRNWSEAVPIGNFFYFSMNGDFTVPVISVLRGAPADLDLAFGFDFADPESAQATLQNIGDREAVEGFTIDMPTGFTVPVTRMSAESADGQSHLDYYIFELQPAFEKGGWTNLTNTRSQLEVGGVSLAFAGVDDPHLGYDDLASVAGPAPEDVDLRIGVAHAPYLRVLDQYARDGYDVTFAGHTHGGQVCLPFKGAIVTNCDLDTKRAKGLHRHPADSRPDDPGSSWLHVSAGAGTSPYAPIRVCCRPEATLLTLLPKAS